MPRAWGVVILGDGFEPEWLFNTLASDVNIPIRILILIQPLAKKKKKKKKNKRCMPI